MTSTVTFHRGDVRDVMAAMPDGSVDFLVTSPPFLALRSYLPDGHPDKHREIGSEPTPAAFLDTMLGLTAEWRRLVAPWGSIAVEIGDTYSGSGGAGGDYNTGGLRDGQAKFDGSNNRRGKIVDHNSGRRHPGPGWPMAKSLCGIPTLYTWSLAYGRNLLTGTPSPAGQLRVRNLLTWTRPNPPVGALGDKFRPATSFVTVACVSDKRWFDLDAVRTPLTEPGRVQRRIKGSSRSDGWLRPQESIVQNEAGAPPLDWWDANDLDPDETDWQPLHRLPTQPYKGSHYAAFPVALPGRLIEACCPREVCRECGEPRRRIVEHERTFDKVGKSAGRSEARTPNAGPMGAVYEVTRTTIGWADCGHGDYRPGIVLDPFGGSGTTAVAAALAGRDCVLIDLDHRNVELARERLADAMRVVSEDGRAGRTPKAGAPKPICDTVVWTVEPGLPGVRGELPGQMSLFDEVSA